MLLIVTGLLLLQLGLVSISFPVTELFTANPLFHIDAPYHWYQMKTAVNLAQTGNLVGYDPFFGAGYLGGVTYSLSDKVPSVLAIIFNNLADEVVVYKVHSFLAAVIAPALVPLALRVLGLNRTGIVVGSAIGLMLWWTSMFRWFYTAGMVAFVFGAYLGLLYVALMFFCWKTAASWVWYLLLVLIGALGLFFNPVFPVPIAVACMVFLVVEWDGFTLRKGVIILGLVPLLIVCLNLIWLVPLYLYPEDLHGAKFAGFQKVVDVNLIWSELLGVWKGNSHGSKLYAPILIAAIWGCIGAKHRAEQRVAWVFTASGVMLVVFAALGAAIPETRMLEPNRYFPVGYLLMVVAAAMGFPAMFRFALETRGTAVRIVAFFSLLLTFPPLLYSANEVRREVSHADIGHYGDPPPEVKGFGDYSKWLVGWLTRNTSDDARILFETSLGRVHDGGHMAGYYAYEAGREFIGGPYPFKHFAGFVDGMLFDRPIKEISAEEFKKFMDLYNVAWVIVHSAESKRYLEKIPGVVALDRFKELQTYKIERVPSYFISGTGRVLQRGHNNLVLADLAGDRVILKYHYVRGLVSEPAARIAPAKMDGDPGPFIMILNPPKKLRLFIP